MSTYNLPIIIAEGLDINFYSSVENATDSIEVVDVEDNVYKGYDSVGNLVIFSTKNNKVSISVDYQKNLEKELKKLLLNFLSVVGIDCEGNDESLLTLLKKCEKYYQ